jgi:hypothetical protein
MPHEVSGPRLYTPLIALFVFLAAPAFAQQTGSIAGKVLDSQGGVLPGVTVEARSPVLPGPRSTVTAGDGTYQLPALPPGEYTVTFTLSGMQTVTRNNVAVQLSESTPADAAMVVAGVTEAVTVTAESRMIDKTSAEITSDLSHEKITSLPVGTQYRDLINLIPGVQYTQDQVRGPSAGASGQDNVYNFDGVNVTLPLFGTLSAEPASYDIAQVTVVKGGARAVDFNRAGGFDVDSVSRSGTSAFHGLASYRFQTVDMAAAQTGSASARYDEDRGFTDLNIGGPIWKDHLYFYASYYRPTAGRSNASTAYGAVPDFNSDRNEGFGKVTFTPTHSTLINASYRSSHRLDTGAQFGPVTAGTAGSGAEAWQRIGTADGSWIINGASFLTFKYTHFENPTRGRPDHVSDAVIDTAPGTHLDTAHLDQLGLFTVPKPGTNAAVNAFIQPIVNQYGFLTNGVPTGGGIVGYGSIFDEDNFFRDAGQVGYNITLFGLGLRHTIHAGYQQYVDSEDLIRSSNGWGSINVPGGAVSFKGTPIYYQTVFQAQGAGAVPTIHSEYHSKSFEVNDSIAWKNWVFNVGLVASNDTLYGQGLTEDSSTLSGYVKSTGNTPDSRKYKMYDIPFSKMLQPRLSATWAYDDKSTIFGSYARYNPAASSLPRAASWDRNLAATQNADFDASGNLFAVENVPSSSGKLFVPDLTPRRFDEWLVGTSRQFTPRLSGRAYFRYRKGTHYWEDTNNNARVDFGAPADTPHTLYIPNLSDQLAQIGSGSTFVIAGLDGAFTDYRELTLEGEYRNGRTWFQGSYTRSRYYGNFDQDASSTADLNDQNIFIGSSNIGDDPGRQLWNDKLGLLRGDRPNVFKAYGVYFFHWNGSVGAFITAQSGQPWETHSYLPYAALTTSTSDTDRYSEPAGSHRSDGHGQLDLNYTQTFGLTKGTSVVLAAYLFNVFDSQTAYNVQPNLSSALYGQPMTFYAPRRLEIAARFQF